MLPKQSDPNVRERSNFRLRAQYRSRPLSLDKQRLPKHLRESCTLGLVENIE